MFNFANKVLDTYPSYLQTTDDGARQRDGTAGSDEVCFFFSRFMFVTILMKFLVFGYIFELSADDGQNASTG
jgi:hypothetical protein